MSTELTEKRDFLRVPFPAAANVRAGSLVVRAKSELTISMKGLGFVTDDPLPVAGVPCSISIKLPGPGDPVVIEAEGIVVRSEQGRVSIEFSSLDLEGYQHLRKLIACNADDPDRVDRECEAHLGIRKRPHAVG